MTHAKRLAEEALMSMTLSGGVVEDTFLNHAEHLFGFTKPEHGRAACDYLIRHNTFLSVNAVREAIEKTAPAPKLPEHVALPAPKSKKPDLTPEERKAFLQDFWTKKGRRKLVPTRGSGRPGYTRSMAEIEADLQKQRERVRAMTDEQRAYFADLRDRTGRTV